jgi:hypothetical protein
MPLMTPEEALRRILKAEETGALELDFEFLRRIYSYGISQHLNLRDRTREIVLWETS